MADLSGWIQAGVAGTIATVGTFFWAGDLNRNLADQRTHLEAVAETQKADHDKVISVTTTVSDIREDVAVIKSDVKELISRPARK